jgi:SAM-dependent methyltransferase
MHISFMEQLADPETGGPLTLEVTAAKGDLIESGVLRAGARSYPIKSGVPRFVEDNNYAESFGYQWHKWPRVQFESANVGKPMAGHTLRMWERITGQAAGSSVRGQTLVDMGCGPGRFIDVARSKGARVIGIDYSAAVDVAHDNFRSDPDVCVCQADALKLPLRSASVDGVFSIGVLHHTPNPEKGVKQAWLALRDNGWFAVSVYGKGGFYDFPTVHMWRKLFKALWPALGHYPPLLYTNLTVYGLRPLALRNATLGRAVRVLFPFVKLADIDWSLLDTFDSVTPSFQSAHESYEVFSWFRNAGFTSIEPTDWGFTSYRGIRVAP